MSNILITAINNKQSINFQYDGFNRKGSPHILGYKMNVLHCLVYQYFGNSKSGESIGWKCLEVSKMKNISINNDNFLSGNSHKQKQTCIDRIITSV